MTFNTAIFLIYTLMTVGLLVFAWYEGGGDEEVMTYMLIILWVFVLFSYISA